MSVVPPTLARYLIPEAVLVETRELLQERGALGVEGVVLWVGCVLSAETAEVSLAFMPPQVAYQSSDGLAVEVPQDALSELIAALPDDVFVLARVHSHPGEPFHSPLDDTNMLIAHEGAVSVVVPDFARDPINLERCSVNVLHHGRGWVELDRDEIRDRFEVR